MSDGDERQRTQEALQAAIEDHVRAHRSEFASADVEITGEWILVVAVTSLDLENQERRYAYNLGFSGGEMPEHIAYGLLTMGQELLRNGEAS